MASARGFFNLSAHQRPNVGDTKTSVVDIDHLGWLKCDGRALLKNEWKFLFDVIGYSFGSNTSNDFFLPSPAGRVVGYTGSGAGLTTRAMGSNFGTETHTLTVAEMPTHNHTGTTDPAGNAAESEGVSNTLNQAQVSGSLTHTHTFTTSNAGGSNAHNNMQPTLFLGNLFIYSGKVGYGNNPFTAGIFTTVGAGISGSNLV